jgi:tRNA A-37 threonylcarbamoyl transferase component Bud32
MHSLRASNHRSGQRLCEACAELERRLRAGQPCAAEDLFAAFPALATEAEAALEVIFTEFVVREHLGQRPDPADWFARFPQWQRDLEQLFQVHRAVGPSQAARSHDTLRTLDPGDALRTESGGVGRRFGNYELLEELGRGGMGVVYKARHEGLGRTVALKLILAGDYCRPQELARFRTEAVAAARLQHPNIVQVHEVGEQDGRPYLSLELVNGGSLEEKLAAAPWRGRDAARLVEVLARAMHYAHERGVIHRDLKPANVLLTSDGTPKITDFGLARRLPQSATQWDVCEGPTESGAVLGTPSYMAPEQATGRSRAVGPAADVYALGAILYALLTGRPPFRGVTALETMHQVYYQEPVPPTRLQPRLPRDLETICLKCLLKDPPRRYASAAALADDLSRFQVCEPIRARPICTWERAMKWGKRRPGIAALLVAVVAVTALGLTSTTCLWRQAEQARAAEKAEREKVAAALIETEQAREAEKVERKKGEAVLAAKTVALARQAWLTDDLDQARRCLDECPPAYRDREWGYLHRVCHSCLNTFDVSRRLYTGASKSIWSPNGAYLASVVGFNRTTQKVTILVWEAATGREAFTFAIDSKTFVHDIAFTADSRRLVFAGYYGGFDVRVWDLLNGTEVMPVDSTTHPTTVARHAGLSSDGRWLATVGISGELRFWEVATGKQLPRFPFWTKTLFFLALSPDGGVVSYVDGELPERTVHFLDRTTGNEVYPAQRIPGLQTVGFSSDAQRIVAHKLNPDLLSPDLVVRETSNAREVFSLRGQINTTPYTAAFSDDSRYFATADKKRGIILWDLSTGKELLTFRGHRIAPNYLAFSPDGRRLASTSWGDGTIKIWDVRPLEKP